jgi:hypothetical protein
VLEFRGRERSIGASYRRRTLRQEEAPDQVYDHSVKFFTTQEMQSVVREVDCVNRSRRRAMRIASAKSSPARRISISSIADWVNDKLTARCRRGRGEKINSALQRLEDAVPVMLKRFDMLSIHGALLSVVRWLIQTKHWRNCAKKTVGPRTIWHVGPCGWPYTTWAGEIVDSIRPAVSPHSLPAAGRTGGVPKQNNGAR